MKSHEFISVRTSLKSLVMSFVLVLQLSTGRPTSWG